MAIKKDYHFTDNLTRQIVTVANATVFNFAYSIIVLSLPQKGGENMWDNFKILLKVIVLVLILKILEKFD